MRSYISINFLQNSGCIILSQKIKIYWSIWRKLWNFVLLQFIFRIPGRWIPKPIFFNLLFTPIKDNIQYFYLIFWLIRNTQVFSIVKNIVEWLESTECNYKYSWQILQFSKNISHIDIISLNSFNAIQKYHFSISKKALQFEWNPILFPESTQT